MIGRSGWRPLHGGLAARDFGDGAAGVDRDRLPARLVLPGNGTVERPVDLANAGAVPEPLHRPAVARRQADPAEVEHLAGRKVEQDRLRRRNVGQRAHGMADDHLAPVGQQQRHQRIGDGL
jgi:hypothetical protein